MREFKTRQEAFFGRDLHVVQDHFPSEEAVRIWAKIHAYGDLAQKRGIKQGIWWEEFGEGKDILAEEEVREYLSDHVTYLSERPFFPGDACDGTRDACLWACLSDAIAKSRADLGQFARAVADHLGEGYLSVRGIRRGAQLGFWEGTWCPKAWDREALGDLMGSMNSMNRGRLSTMIEEEQTAEGTAWMEVLATGPGP